MGSGPSSGQSWEIGALQQLRPWLSDQFETVGTDSAVQAGVGCLAGNETLLVAASEVNRRQVLILPH